MNGELSQAAAIFLMLNNYVHDVATGLLLISALWVAWSARELGEKPAPAAVDLFMAMYRKSVRFVWGAVVVIVGTGVIRTVNFMRFEWQPAFGRGLVPVLVMKHVLIFTLLGVGGYAWLQLRRRLGCLEGWRE
jgi:hypothetical protein